MTPYTTTVITAMDVGEAENIEVGDHQRCANAVTLSPSRSLCRSGRSVWPGANAKSATSWLCHSERTTEPPPANEIDSRHEADLGHDPAILATVPVTRPDGTPYPAAECLIYQAFREGEGTHVDNAS